MVFGTSLSPDKYKECVLKAGQAIKRPSYGMYVHHGQISDKQYLENEVRADNFLVKNWCPAKSSLFMHVCIMQPEAIKIIKQREADNFYGADYLQRLQERSSHASSLIQDGHELQALIGTFEIKPHLHSCTTQLQSMS